MSILLALLGDLAKTLLPALLQFIWEKAHESATTVEDAANDAPTQALRDRLLDAIAKARPADSPADPLDSFGNNRLRAARGGGADDNTSPAR